MEKKLFCIGILVMVLVFGLTFVGCDSDPNKGDNREMQGRWTWVENNTDVPITKVVFTTEGGGAGQIILTDNQGVPAHSKKVYDVGLRGEDHSWIWIYVSVTVSEQVVHSTVFRPNSNSYDNISQSMKYCIDNDDTVIAASLRKTKTDYFWLKSERKKYFENKKAIDPILYGNWQVGNSSYDRYEFTQDTFKKITAGSTSSYSGVYSESIRIFYSSGQQIFSSWYYDDDSSSSNYKKLFISDATGEIICTKIVE